MPDKFKIWQFMCENWIIFLCKWIDKWYKTESVTVFGIFLMNMSLRCVILNGCVYGLFCFCDKKANGENGSSLWSYEGAKARFGGGPGADSQDQDHSFLQECQKPWERSLLEILFYNLTVIDETHFVSCSCILLFWLFFCLCYW